MKIILTIKYPFIIIFKSKITDEEVFLTTIRENLFLSLKSNKEKF